MEVTEPAPRVIEPLVMPEPPPPAVLTRGPRGQRLADGETVTRKSEPPTTEPGPTELQQAIWDAVEIHDTRDAAAAALDVTHSTVYSALLGYMDRQGMEGPPPGEERQKWQKWPGDTRTRVWTR